MSGIAIVLAVGFVLALAECFYLLWQWRQTIARWGATLEDIHALREAILADSDLDSRAWQTMGEQLRRSVA